LRAAGALANGLDLKVLTAVELVDVIRDVLSPGAAVRAGGRASAADRGQLLLVHGLCLCDCLRSCLMEAGMHGPASFSNALFAVS
jgi:hypothetical protein